MSKIILHIGSYDKFLPPVIKFVRECFDFNRHEFLLYDDMGYGQKKLNITPNEHLVQRSLCHHGKRHYWKGMIKMHQTDKVIFAQSV